MKKFRKVLDGLTTSSPGSTIGSPSCGSAAGTPTAAPTPREIDIPETLVSENFQLCKVGARGVFGRGRVGFKPEVEGRESVDFSSFPFLFFKMEPLCEICEVFEPKV